MNSTSQVLRSVLLILVVVTTMRTVLAQRLHDEARDKEAQKASQLAEEITSKSNFDKQLKNLEILANRDLEVYFTGAKRQMGLDIRTFRTWQAVTTFLAAVKSTLDAPDVLTNAQAQAIESDLKLGCSARTSDLGKAICAAQAKLAALKAQVAASEAEGKRLEEELKSRLEKIDLIESLVNKGQSFLKAKTKDNQAIKDTTAVLFHLAESYANFANKLAVIKNQPNDELRLLLQRIAVEALALEVDHWKTVGQITSRRTEEQRELRNLVADVEFRMRQISKCLSIDEPTLNGEKLTATFVRAQAVAKCTILDTPGGSNIEILKEEIVTYLCQTLYSAAALAARGATPMKLAELRLAHESHRFSIRHSALMARTYEVALTSGTKRLARFYAGGLRPEKVAQLIYTAATVAIPTVIAAK